MTGAWKLDLPAGPKLVLLSLCDNANEQGECFPSVSMISKRCSMGERTVQAHIQSLTQMGLMCRSERNGRSTVYQLDPRKICTPADSAPPQISHPTPAIPAPLPPQISRGTPADFAPITINESSIETKKGRAVRPAPPRPDDVSEQVWDDWLAHRKARKAAVTQTVLSEAIRESVKAGVSLERFLSIWCSRGSTGLQADWLKPHERGSQQATGETAYQRSMRERAEQITPRIAAKAPGAFTNVIEMEVPDVIAGCLGGPRV